MAVPAYCAAELLQSLSPDMAESLLQIPYASATVIGLGYKKDDFPNSLDGFGFLTPGMEKKEILGCLWTSSIFPGFRSPEDSVLLRIIMGGMRRPDLIAESEETLYKKVEKALEEAMGIKVSPIFRAIKKWEAAIPQYQQGHQTILDRLDANLKSFPGLYLTGNGYRGISLPDCILNSNKLAEEMLASS